MSSPRTSGVFLHITSLPSAYGIGDLGPAAYRFADFLRRAGQRLWQVLPLGPVGAGASPYSSSSSFAGNPLLISPEPLLRAGLLQEKEVEPATRFPAGRVDYERVIPFKTRLLETAFERFEQDASAVDQDAYERFRRQNAGWLEDYTLYMALKEAHDEAGWTAWSEALRRREPSALEEARNTHRRAIEKHTFWQYLFYRQWEQLKAYCHKQSVQLFGDLPIYTAHDSADVWANQELFYLDEARQPTVVSGVPPDYFSETGQRWGNPIYRWDRMKENGYAWWSARLKAVLGRVDIVRLDHFRGFEAYWEIPAEEETAVNGQWIKGPGADFFETLRETLGELPVVAEDLGTITPAVRRLMREVRIPGMAVLPFGLGDGPDSTNLPHHFRARLVAYTSTHDTDTFAGWYATQVKEGRAKMQAYTRQYFGLSDEGEGLHWAAIRAVMASVAQRVIVPLQDVLGLGSEARMNTPGLGGDNWSWRCLPEHLTDDLAHRLATLTKVYDRTGRRRTAQAAESSLKKHHPTSTS